MMRPCVFMTITLSVACLRGVQCARGRAGSRGLGVHSVAGLHRIYSVMRHIQPLPTATHPSWKWSPLSVACLPRGRDNGRKRGHLI